MSGIEAVQGRIAQIQGQIAAVAARHAAPGGAAGLGGAAGPGAAASGVGVSGGGMSGAGTAGDFARTLVGAQAASAGSASGGLTVTRAAPVLDRSLLARPATLITAAPSGGAPAAAPPAVQAPAAPPPAVQAPAAPPPAVQAPAAPVPAVGAPGAGVPAAPAPPSSSGGSRYDGLFAAATQRYGLPQGLLRAVAVTESGLKPDAVSRAGARGLMQIMPGTARALKVDPFDPAQAVDGAGRLLRDHLKSFGSLELALAAYNAGPGAVRKHGGIPPYAETQSYVRKVTALLAQGAPR